MLLSVDFVVELPNGKEAIALAHLDTESGEVSGIKGLPEGIAPESAWIDVQGGSELFFRVRSFGDGMRYQIENMADLVSFKDQFEWLALAQCGDRRTRLC